MNRPITVSIAVACVFTVASLCMGETDAEALASRLVARRQSLPQGTLQTEWYVAVMPKSAYESLRKNVFSSPVLASSTSIREQVVSQLSQKGVFPIAAFTETLYYKHDSGEQWRTVRERIETFGRQKEVLQAEAQAKSARIHATDSEDISFDGTTVMALENGKQLVYKEKGKGLNYPRVDNVDLSFGPWAGVYEQKALPNQTISTSVRDGLQQLIFTNKEADGTSSVEYGFSPEFGYAPVRISGERNGNPFLEWLWCYDKQDEEALWTPRISCKADYKKDGTVRVEVRLVNKWARQVLDEDLHIKLPDKYTIVDERYGSVPLLVQRDKDVPPLKDPTADVQSIEDHASARPKQLPGAAASATRLTGSASLSSVQQQSPPVRWVPYLVVGTGVVLLFVGLWYAAAARRRLP